MLSSNPIDVAKKELIGLLYELRDLLRSFDISPVSKNRVRRILHSLKAVLLSMEMDEYASRVHDFELLLVEDSSLFESSDLLNFISELESSLVSSSSDHPTDDVVVMRSLLSAFHESVRRGEKIFKVVISVSGDESYRYARLYLAFSRLEDACAVISCVPDIINMSQEEIPDSIVVFCSCYSEDSIREALAVDLISFSVSMLSEAELGFAKDVAIDSLVATRSMFVAFEKGWRAYREYVAKLGSELEFEHFDRLIASLFRIRAGELFSYAVSEAKRLVSELGKLCEVVVLGQDVIIPAWWRAGLDFVFVHLVRNAVVHGIELPDERKKNGKSEVGRIEFGARVSDSELMLWLADDGRGVPASDGDVSVFSGMGVGMDVVRDIVSSLGGGLEVIDRESDGRLVKMVFPSSFL
ncbi:ATP-binding protein [Spirochaetia bacterium 38H-sp]|uniref:histidine kinase n=1 Tax=Rarispira pelagica TaxID=3141764 RepID=A0ABU9UD89_9SPIR